MKILIIDDHPLVRTALEWVVAELSQIVEVQGVDCAKAAHSALLEKPDQDLILLDLGLPDVSGLSLLQQLRQSYPAIPVVVISASDSAQHVTQAIDAGAMGFIPKNTSNAVLVQALRIVLAGGVYVPATALAAPKGLSDVIRPAFNHSALTAEGTKSHQNARDFVDTLPLTIRQAEVLKLLLLGHPNKIIAQKLDLSLDTVKDHVTGLLRSLGVQTRTQAVLMISEMMQNQQSPS